MEIGRHNPFIMNQYAARGAAHPDGNRHTEDFNAVLEHAGQNAEQKETAEAAESGKDMDYRKFLLEKMEEMRTNIKNGTIQPKIQIGGEAYTQEEWEKLLEKIDAAEEVIRKQVEAETTAAKEAAKEEDADSGTRIITRADGARILLVTTSFGEMSIELSKPDDSAAYSDMINESVDAGNQTDA